MVRRSRGSGPSGRHDGAQPACVRRRRCDTGSRRGWSSTARRADCRCGAVRCRAKDAGDNLEGTVFPEPCRGLAARLG
jgi:hypothetical protein